jgi:hypothetical protein
LYQEAPEIDNWEPENDVEHMQDKDRCDEAHHARDE